MTKSLVDSNLAKIETVYTSSYDAVKEIRKRFPNSMGVAVCAFNTVDAYFEDATFTNHVADIDYHYSRSSKQTSLFGYDYKLVWKV